MRDLYDEMLEDIEEQEKKKPTQFDIEKSEYYDDGTQSLNDLERYDMDDEAEDDFDIAYRTPDFVYEDSPRNPEDFIGTVLPEEITVTDNPDEYFDEKHKKHPGFANMWPGRPDYEDLKKHDVYKESASQENLGTGAMYDPVFDEIALDESFIKQNTFGQNIMSLAHENIHKKQRNIEYRQPTPRVLSEPNTKLFQEMAEENVIKNDFSNFLKGTRIGNGPDRDKIIKNRQEELQDFKNSYPFSEQLAYYGEKNIRRATRNPKRKTDRILNRMWFQ